MTQTAIAEKWPIQIGIDVGKVHDPSAICVTEVSQHGTGRYRQRGHLSLGGVDHRGGWIPPQGIAEIMRTEYTVRHITRLPLGKSYPDIALHIADLLDSPLFVGRAVAVYIDITGVGRPVYDMVLELITERKEGVWHADGTFHFTAKSTWHVRMRPITFVSGEKYNRSKGTAGKAYIVSRLQTHLQHGRFHAPDIAEVKAMLGELRTYAITLNEHGHEQYGAESGKHDDLATAAALSVLADPFSEQVKYSERIF